MKRENLENYIELNKDYAQMDTLLENGDWKVVRYKTQLAIVPRSVDIRVMEHIAITVKDGTTNNKTFLAWLREKLEADHGTLLFAEIMTQSQDGKEVYPNYYYANKIVNG